MKTADEIFRAASELSAWRRLDVIEALLVGPRQADADIEKGRARQARNRPDELRSGSLAGRAELAVL